MFDSVEELFEKCFVKKQNYKVQGNGRITIRYKIELESDKMGKEIVLHLLPVEMGEFDMYKEMYRKIKDEKDKMEEGYKKYENVLKNNKWEEGSIIPFRNDHSSHFVVERNSVRYTATNSWRMLVLNTVLVDMQHYDCTASYIGNTNIYTCIGIVSEQHLQAQHVWDAKINSLCYYPNDKGIYKNSAKVVDVKLDSQNYVNMVVRVQVDVREGTAVFTITNSAKTVEQHSIQLGDLTTKGNIYPFIQTHKNGAQVNICLK